MPVTGSKEVKTALNKQMGGFLNTFSHSLQPYTGCAFGQQTQNGQGCPYCYVRKLPVSLFAKAEWGEWVEAKRNIGDVLRRELQSHHKKGHLSNLRIFMSSATDPYQGAESTYRLTRACLEAFTEFPPGLLVVQTRSPLVLRDLDLLRDLKQHVWVSLTLETNDDAVRKLFTPTSPTVGSRFRAMESLMEAGVRVQAAVSPMLPNEVATFVDRLDAVCDRVIVDTLFHGDGAKGRRSESLGMARVYEEHGYPEWYQPGAHLELLAALTSKLGQERVAFSQEGFNTMS